MRHPGPPRRDESKRIEDEIEVSVGNNSGVSRLSISAA
ncbi:hypothetical protein NpPPO83_00005666 [Neofusicoccum parvum]|uniref:Uncharacterized protein n=1 Tax=Neofusicoccum parvum TaxID=310453 RepID=A0ACB5RRQ8_9PEZI|nr:hypothetical protein NpPPO83_00005666 [Neofusicoccum parvum]